jgi:hypothetical protein
VDADTTAPSKLCPPPKRIRSKAPLGNGRRALLLLLPSLIWLPLPSKYFYLHDLYNYFLMLRKRNEALEKLKAKDQTGAFGVLFSLMCVRSITREPLFIGGPWV